MRVDGDAGATVAGVARAIDALARVLAYSGFALLLTSAAVTVADVAGRSLGLFTILGLVDITQLLVMAGVSLVFPLTFAREANVSVDTLGDRLGPVGNRIALTTAAVFAALCMAGLSWFSMQQAWLQVGQGDRSQTIGIPIAWFWVPLLVGCTGSAVCAALKALQHGSGAVAATEPAKGGDPA